MDRPLLNFAVVLLATLSACAPEDVSEPAPRTTRQAMGQPLDLDAGRLVKGNGLLAHLGTTVARCPTAGYIAGAPGSNTAWFSPLARLMNAEHKTLLASTPQYFPVACDGPSSVLTRGLIGGPDYSTNISIDGGTSRFAAFRVDSFAVPPTGSLPLAVGDSVVGAVTLFPSSTSQLLTGTTVLSGYGASFATSMTWNLNVLAVGFPEQTTVTLATMGLGADAGFTVTNTVGLADPEPQASSDFGKVVVSGNVTAQTGDEFIVASPSAGRVYIFSGTSLVMTLRGGPSFGASLAVDPRIVGGGLHALWVGEPTAEQVHRYFGSEETIYSSPIPGGSHFGAALAIDSQGLLAVGAPDYNDGLALGAGVVVEANIDGGTRQGVAMLCNTGANCQLPSCFSGQCVGDVFCEKASPVTLFCGPNEMCEPASNICVAVIPDGGVPDGSVDAGSVDAGSVDAGSEDAGPVDAGSDDAGAVDADAGPADAGSPDAGHEDAGTHPADAGELTDAGAPDAGADEDVALAFHTCGCTSGGLPLLLLGLLLARRRRG